mmetsp:Transcript_17092/g.25758  ORF Transcript_17092/g.25758 Transcript_17092/m.25758 type:complete len:250 (+) Transcript_17092:1475-2224(+)
MHKLHPVLVMYCMLKIDTKKHLKHTKLPLNKILRTPLLIIIWVLFFNLLEILIVPLLRIKVHLNMIHRIQLLIIILVLLFSLYQNLMKLSLLIKQLFCINLHMLMLSIIWATLYSSKANFIKLFTLTNELSSSNLILLRRMLILSTHSSNLNNSRNNHSQNPRAKVVVFEVLHLHEKLTLFFLIIPVGNQQLKKFPRPNHLFKINQQLINKKSKNKYTNKKKKSHQTESSSVFNYFNAGWTFLVGSSSS